MPHTSHSWCELPPLVPPSVQQRQPHAQLYSMLHMTARPQPGVLIAAAMHSCGLAKCVPRFSRCVPHSASGWMSSAMTSGGGEAGEGGSGGGGGEGGYGGHLVTRSLLPAKRKWRPEVPTNRSSGPRRHGLPTLKSTWSG